MAKIIEVKMLSRQDISRVVKAFTIIVHNSSLDKYGWVNVEDNYEEKRNLTMFWENLPNEIPKKHFIKYIEKTTKDFLEYTGYCEGSESERYKNLYWKGKEMVDNKKIINSLLEKEGIWLDGFNKSGEIQLQKNIDTKLDIPSLVEKVKAKVSESLKLIDEVIKYDLSLDINKKISNDEDMGMDF